METATALSQRRHNNIIQTFKLYLFTCQYVRQCLWFRVTRHPFLFSKEDALSLRLMSTAISRPITRNEEREKAVDLGLNAMMAISVDSRSIAINTPVVTGLSAQLYTDILRYRSRETRPQATKKDQTACKGFAAWMQCLILEDFVSSELAVLICEYAIHKLPRCR